MTQKEFFEKAYRTKVALINNNSEFDGSLREAIPLTHSRLTKDGKLCVEINLDDIKGSWDLKEKQQLLDESNWITVTEKKGDHLRTIEFEVPEPKVDPNKRIHTAL